MDNSLYWEPRKIALEKIEKVPNEPEMTEFESAFLCGLIKDRKPRKILEIGVAAGGTTSIILQCIDLLKLNESCEVISVDLNELFYRKDGHETGFLAKQIKDKIEKVNHRFLLGKVLPERIEEIGNEIDFVVLDTVHFLPGELLDILVLLPYLAKDACVVLHDIAYHQYIQRDGIATQVVLELVNAKKIIPFGQDKSRNNPMPNIAAFVVDDDTKKHVDSIFLGFTQPWWYMPDREELATYRKFYVNHYEKSELDVYDMAIELNDNRLKREQKENRLLKRVIRYIKWRFS